MKNPYSKNTRAVDTVGKALFESGPYNDSAVGAGLIFGAAMISIFVGLVGIGSFPLLVILLCTCIPFVICGTLALWLGFGAPPDYTVYEKISYAYKKSQLCSNMCRDVAESIVRDMVRISNSDAPKDYKTDSLDKRTKVLNT